ncbi:hypothetical protein OUY22_11105 [Nonomuraea sp. MCN248]|uniref:DUF2079 domain-containing protein n=1 Tax=Nonomuraea corallina TaxID=2989783 RepID=A0ABT4SAF0_9ACTN|nr:hypothetical protein [Nonomuraea corallina]MDA0633965.1 hypothetical protein [Nonomuraea corallina]
MPHQARAALAGAVLGLTLATLALGPALSWGFVLIHDMVFVPDPAFSRFTFGLAGGAPRVVPSDAVVTALSQVLPGELVQKLILLAVFVLGASGVAVLVPSPGLAPRLAAAAFYVWNPYVAERLLIGQWALLLGYAGLPWVVHALCRGRRLAVSLLPAATGGFAAMLVTAVTALPVAALLRRPARAGAADGDHRGPWARVLRTGVVLGAFCLPWLVPAALRPHGLAGDPVGVEAFASRADTPFGTLGSLLSLGGIWNANAVPVGYGEVVGAVARLLLTVVGIAAFVRLGRGLPYRNGLALAGVIGFAIAGAGVTEAGRSALKWLVGVWGGFAVFRDAQQYVAPVALLAAVGIGLLAAAAARVPGAVAEAGRVPEAEPERVPAAGRDRGRRAPAGVLAGLLVAVPVAVLPTMAWGALGALDAVPYPRAWYEARVTLRDDPAPGDVLVLPFESYRRFDWNGGRPVLDPAQRFFAVPGRRVVTNDVVRVGELVVRSEDPRATEVERVLEGRSPDLAGLGFRYVIVDAGTVEECKRFADWLRDAEVVVDAPELRLYRLEPSRTP